MDWLHVNDKIISDFQLVTFEKEITDKTLMNASNEVRILQDEFNVLVHKNPDPTGFKLTDQFFLNGENGVVLFNLLKLLQKHFEAKPLNDKIRLRFEYLFKNDLDNGLREIDFNKWVDWKFKHVPTSLAMTMLNELSVRFQLLNGSINFQSINEKKLLQISFDLSNLHINDTAKIVIDKRNIKNIKIFYKDKINNDWFIIGDSLYFVPQRVGDYTCIVEGIDNSKDKLNINVTPMTFDDLLEDGEKNGAIKYFFQGKPSRIVSASILAGSSWIIEGSKWIDVNVKRGELQFTPSESGNFLLKLLDKSGLVYFEDSIFIQPTPKPVVFVEKASNNKISTKKLKLEGSLRLKVFHPLHPDIKYNIESIDLRFIGIDIVDMKSETDLINFDVDQISNVKFIQIRKIKVKTSVSSFSIVDPLLLEVI